MLEHVIYRNRGEQANHYNIDAVCYTNKLSCKFKDIKRYTRISSSKFRPIYDQKELCWSGFLQIIGFQIGSLDSKWDHWIPNRITGFQMGSLDSKGDHWIANGITWFQIRSLDSKWDHWIPNEIIGFQMGSLDSKWDHRISNGITGPQMRSLDSKWDHWILKGSLSSVIMIKCVTYKCFRKRLSPPSNLYPFATPLPTLVLDTVESKWVM